MTDPAIVVPRPLWPAELLPPKKPIKACLLQRAWQAPDRLPSWVSDSPTAMRTLD